MVLRKGRGAGARDAARVALARALRGAVADGEGVPCLRPGWGPLFTSDDPDELAEAAEACGPCPVLAECRAAGANEYWGVWGGGVRMRGTRPRDPNPPRKPQLAPVLLATLATATRPLSSAALAHAVAPTLGFTPNVASVGAAMAVLRARGHCDNITPHRFGHFVITDDGRAAAEALGRVSLCVKPEGDRA